MNGKDKNNEAFIRWHGITINQLGFLNNLLIGLATGLLAFETQLAFNEKVVLSCIGKILIVLSILLITASVGIGIGLARNRLNDFRKTTQINNERRKGRIQADEKLKTDATNLGEKTWQLLELQTWSFVFGGLFLVVATLIKYLFR